MELTGKHKKSNRLKCIWTEQHPEGKFINKKVLRSYNNLAAKLSFLLRVYTQSLLLNEYWFLVLATDMLQLKKLIFQKRALIENRSGIQLD